MHTFTEIKISTLNTIESSTPNRFNITIIAFMILMKYFFIYIIIHLKILINIQLKFSETFFTVIEVRFKPCFISF